MLRESLNHCAGPKKSSGETPSCSTSRPSHSSTLFGLSVANSARHPVLPRAGRSPWRSISTHTAWFATGGGMRRVTEPAEGEESNTRTAGLRVTPAGDWHLCPGSPRTSTSQNIYHTGNFYPRDPFEKQSERFSIDQAPRRLAVLWETSVEWEQRRRSTGVELYLGVALVERSARSVLTRASWVNLPTDACHS